MSKVSGGSGRPLWHVTTQGLLCSPLQAPSPVPIRLGGRTGHSSPSINELGSPCYIDRGSPRRASMRIVRDQEFSSDFSFLPLVYAWCYGHMVFSWLLRPGAQGEYQHCPPVAPATDSVCITDVCKRRNRTEIRTRRSSPRDGHVGFESELPTAEGKPSSKVLNIQISPHRFMEASLETNPLGGLPPSGPSTRSWCVGVFNTQFASVEICTVAGCMCEIIWPQRCRLM